MFARQTPPQPPTAAAPMLKLVFSLIPPTAMLRAPAVEVKRPGGPDRIIRRHAPAVALSFRRRTHGERPRVPRHRGPARGRGAGGPGAGGLRLAHPPATGGARPGAARRARAGH